MFKDYHKYLSTSLKVYLFVLLITFILKLVGLNYFGINANDLLMKIYFYISKYTIDYFIQYFLLYVNFHLIKSITLQKYKIDFETVLIPTINIIITILMFLFNCQQFYQIFNMLLLFVYFLIKKVKITRIIKVFVINIIIQFLSSIVRDYDIQNYKILYNLIMNIDYYIMLIIWYKIEKQGGVEKWVNFQEVGSYLQMKANLKNLPIKLQKSLHSFKQLDKKSKISISLYFAFSLIWNVSTVLLVLFVARMNHTLIECIFILTSFWLSKKAFGRPFHLKNMAHCFVVSNITYYVLNRITLPLHISIFVPILLGVGLSYVTSKLVKKMYKPLYRGMPKDLFDETILKVEDKNSLKYNICYEYYIEKKMAINLSIKYHYSEAGIRKILKIVNKKIKELNK